MTLIIFPPIHHNLSEFILCISVYKTLVLLTLFLHAKANLNNLYKFTGTRRMFTTIASPHRQINRKHGHFSNLLESVNNLK